MKASFSLIDEPWIPCVPLDGGLVVESITEVLTNASAYREIYDDSPLVTVALHRLLLAVLYRVCGPTTLREARSLILKGLPVGAIRSYLRKWHDQFDLFDEEHPFYQTAGLLTGKRNGEKWDNEPVSVIRLANEAPAKNQPTLFDHRTYVGEEYMRPAEAARYLVAAQAYALSSSQSSNAQIDGETLETPGCTQCPGIKGIWCWLEGRNLNETFLLNLVPQQDNKLDVAAWERNDYLQRIKRSWEKGQLPRGIADRYTWQTRMVRCVPEGVNKDLVVRKIFFTQGCSPGEYFDDPMCAYVRDKEQNPWSALALRERKAVWRDSHALLRHGDNLRQPRAAQHIANLIESGAVVAEEYTLNVVGIARGKEASKQILWRHDRMPTPAALLRDVDLVERLDTLLQRAELAGRLLGSSAREICTAYLSMGDKKAGPDAVKKLAEEIDPRRTYWAGLEEHFCALLRELPADKDAASDRWYEGVSREAYSAFRRSANHLGQSARAIRARAIVHPSFNPRANNTEKKSGDEEVME